jgi:hypothetical protein
MAMIRSAIPLTSVNLASQSVLPIHVWCEAGNLPLVVQLWSGENGADESGTAVESASAYINTSSSLLNGRVGVERSNDDFELRVDSGLLLGIGTNERNSSNSFTVKTEVLDVSSGLSRTA